MLLYFLKLVIRQKTLFCNLAILFLLIKPEGFWLHNGAGHVFWLFYNVHDWLLFHMGKATRDGNGIDSVTLTNTGQQDF